MHTPHDREHSPPSLTGSHAGPYGGRAHGGAGGHASPVAPRPVARSQLTPKVSPRGGAKANVLLTVEEVGERLRLSRTSVYRLVERRQLPFYRLPGSLRFSAEDVDAFLTARRVETIERQRPL